jgi:hypothetical protein
VAGWGVDLSGLNEAERKLTRLAALLLDLRPFWPRVVPLFVGWMREQFRTEGRFFSTPWPPLSPAYAARKLRLYPSKGILVAEGDLRRGASLPERRATPRTLTLTITWPKEGERLDPQWHQLGTRHMPARPLLSDILPTEAMQELRQAQEEYVEDMIRRVGLAARQRR